MALLLAYYAGLASGWLLDREVRADQSFPRCGPRASTQVGLCGGGESTNLQQDMSSQSDDDPKTFKSLYRSPSFLRFTLSTNVVAAVWDCFSIVSGLAVVYVILRKNWRKISHFERIVLALTLWQLCFDFSLLLQLNLVGHNLDCVYAVFFGPGARDSTGADDDDIGPKHYLHSFAITYRVLMFFQYWCEIGAGLCTNVLTATILTIITYLHMPQWQTKYGATIMLLIAPLSVIFPMVDIMFHSDNIAAYPFRGDKTDDKATIKTEERSYEFNYHIQRTMVGLQAVMCAFNALGSLIVMWKVRYSHTKTKGPMEEVAKRLALYPFIQALTKVPEMAYGTTCIERYNKLSYYKSRDFYACSATKMIALSMTGLLYAVTWFYFQATTREQIRNFFSLFSSKSQTTASPAPTTSARTGVVSGRDEDKPTDLDTEESKEAAAAGTGAQTEQTLDLRQVDDDELLDLLTHQVDEAPPMGEVQIEVAGGGGGLQGPPRPPRRLSALVFTTNPLTDHE